MTDKDINQTPVFTLLDTSDVDKFMGALGLSKVFNRIRPMFYKRYGYSFTKAGYIPYKSYAMKHLGDMLNFWNYFIKNEKIIGESVYAEVRYKKCHERYKEVLSSDDYSKLLVIEKETTITINDKCEYFNKLVVGYKKDYIKC